MKKIQEIECLHERTFCLTERDKISSGRPLLWLIMAVIAIIISEAIFYVFTLTHEKKESRFLT